MTASRASTRDSLSAARFWSSSPLAAGLIFFGYNLKNFRMDASSDSLILENDADLKYYEATRELFGSDDYIVLAVTLREHLLSDDVLRSPGQSFPGA